MLSNGEKKEGKRMTKKLTPKQKRKILLMKEKAIYRHTQTAKKRKENDYVFTRHHIEKLVEAWMTYIDMLGIKKYKSKNFYYKGSHGGSHCCYTDNLFTIGERAAISKYLKENNLVEMDAWNFYVVKWRDCNGKEKTKVDK